RDLFGLQIEKMPGDFFAKWATLWQSRETASLQAAAISFSGIALIFILRRYAPKIPGLLAVVVLASAAAALFHMPVATIGTEFGGIPDALPSPHWPAFTLVKVQEM